MGLNMSGFNALKGFDPTVFPLEITYYEIVLTGNFHHGVPGIRRVFSVLRVIVIKSKNYTKVVLRGLIPGFTFVSLTKKRNHMKKNLSAFKSYVQSIRGTKDENSIV